MFTNNTNNTNDEFLQAFNASLEHLKGVDAIINKQSADKAKFLDIVTKGLTDINAKLQILNTQIAKMKNDLDQLKSQTDNNNAAITQITGVKNETEKQIAQLTAEKTKLEARLKEQQDLCKVTTDRLQQKIDDAEATILKLGPETEALNAQIVALRGQLEAQGADGKTSADQIKQLTESNIKTLADQAAQNQLEIAKLQQEIDEKDKQILALNSNTNNASVQVAAQIAGLESAMQEANAKIRDLSAEITKLKEENQKLIDKIKEATTIINDSLAKLNGLTNEVANAKNLEDIDKLFAAINKTIEDINILLKNQSDNLPPTNPSPNPPPPSIPERLFPEVPTNVIALPEVPDHPIILPIKADTTVLTDVNGNNYSYSWLIGELKKKVNNMKIQGKPTNKYASALTDLYAIKTMDKVEEIPIILYNYNINLKDKGIMGGKTRRYKGGFLIQPKRHVSNKLSRSSKLSRSPRLSGFSKSSSSARLSGSSKSNHSMRKHKSMGGNRTKKRRK
jgi:chromosome segregation ATPase